ncbi:MAG: hypothetical protein AB7J13_13080 [Pyrinomonadaceae bacterium]
MDTVSDQEIWQVESAGSTYEASFDDMRSWIADGSLLRIDRVRKGNLRWIEAGKVPSLVEFFNAKDAETPPKPIVTTSTTEILGAPASVTEFTNAGSPENEISSSTCSIHPDAPAAFLCETCGNQFCKTCPSSYGSTVKICPFCGAMCKPSEPADVSQVRVASPRHTASQAFGIADLGNALVHPFRFKASLVLGAIMFAFASIGQSAVGFGGIFMLVAAIFCFMLANTLTFGILANTIDNFSQGKLDENFMPSFDDFSLWDDVVHPFFLSIGAYISSFGPFLVVAIVAVFVVAGAISDGMTEAGSNTAGNVALPRILDPDVAAEQSKRVRQIIEQKADEQRTRVENIESGVGMPSVGTEPGTFAAADKVNDDTEAMVAEANRLINDHRKAQIESAIGKAPETIAEERAQLLSAVLGYGIVFILLGGLTLLWGVFYFPAACAVAGYTRSFGATLNPLVGLDTIRRLGGDYVKILVMVFAIGVASGIVGSLLSAVFSAFDLPGVGNLPATVVGSLFTFYFSIVFSCILGYALFKNASRLELYSR